MQSLSNRSNQLLMDKNKMIELPETMLANEVTFEIYYRESKFATIDLHSKPR